MPLSHGQQLGKYRIKQRVGAGSMAEVYLAYQPGLDRDVALKVINPQLADNPHFLGRFQNEAKIVAGLHHPNIVPVYDFDTQDDTVYMVMQFVAGTTLNQHLLGLHRQGQTMPPAAILQLFKPMLQAVDYAHRQGVAHLDLKPANVLLTADMQPILVDFGLSQMVGADELSGQTVIVGTPTYMSPEQGAGSPGDTRSDIYALGVMLYEMSTGAPPFTADTAISLILKHLDDPLPPPHAVNPHLPAQIEQIIQRAMEKQPDRRYQTAQAMLDALEAVSLTDLTAADAHPLPDDRPPYRGLRTFEPQDADFYFGREAQVQQLVDMLAAQVVNAPAAAGSRFLAVLGASGSGKSSLVRAGLIPALAANAIPGSEQWAAVILRPGSRPLEQLAAQLESALEMPETVQNLTAALAADSRTLSRVVRQSWANEPPSKKLLLVVDQFEEIFTLCHSQTERRHFIENLLYASAVQQGRVLVLLTMRADFYHRCAAYRNLAGRISAHQFLVGPMANDELRRAIERPAQQVGLKFEPGLVSTILADVERQPGALPLLQHALLELWERRRGRLLTLNDYQEIGGVSQAIARRADAIYAEFSPAKQAVVRRLMLRLTQPGEGTEDTRRRARMQELLSGAEPAQVQAVIQTLADARLITTTLDMSSREEMVDVSHEALIRGWGRLRHWVDSDRAALQTHRQLTEAAVEWQQSERDASYLYRGARLAQAEEWSQAHPQDANQLEQEFLAAGRIAAEVAEREKEEARRRELEQARVLAAEQQHRADVQARASSRLRWLAAGLALVLLVAIGAALIAGDQQRKAQANAAAAEAGRADAEEARSEAFSAQATAEADAVALATAQAQAQSRQQEADASRATAEAERARAEEQAQVALSRQLAAQSLTRRDREPALSLLLSAQANRVANTIEARSTLLNNIDRHHHLISFLHGHSNAIFRVAFNPNGKILATASWDGTVILWDTETHQPLAQLGTGTDSPVLGVAFSPDGNAVAAGIDDGTIWLWDTATFEPLGPPLTGHTNSVWAVAFSPDGQTLASGSRDHSVRFWDWAAGAPLGEPLEGHTDTVLTLAYSPDGKMLASSGDDTNLIFWDTDTGELLEQVTAAADGSIWRVAFSPNGKLLASAAADKTVKLWDTATRRQVGDTLAGHTFRVYDVAFSPNGKLLASASGDDTIRLWDVTTGQQKDEPLTGHGGNAFGVTFSPDGKMLASGGGDNLAILWNVATGQPLGIQLEIIETNNDESKIPVAVNGVSGLVSSVDPDGTLTVYNTANKHFEARISTGQNESVTAVAESDNGKILVTGSKDRTAKVWGLDSGSLTELLTLQHDQPISTLAVSPNGKFVALVTDKFPIRLWDISGNRPEPVGKPLAGHKNNTLDLAFSPDNTILASAGSDQTIRLWDTATGQMIGRPLAGHNSPVNSIAFSPNGALLASGSADKTIILWDVTSRRRLGQLAGHDLPVLSVTFSPDGSLLASSSEDETIRLWDVAARQPTGHYTSHTDPARALAFLPNGASLLSANQSGNIIEWQVNPQTLQEMVCRVANRNFTQTEWLQFMGADTPYQPVCPALPAE